MTDLTSRSSRARRLLGDHRALLAVGVAYLAVQVALSRLGPSYGFDEAVYLSQVAPGHEALPFGAHRARGTTLLLLPVAPLAGHVALVRAWMALLSAVGLVWSFGVWSRVVGARAAALGAGAFALSWTAIAYGPTAMPHVPVALLGVAAAGYVARDLAGGGGWNMAGAAGALALAAAIRPWDAAVAAAGIGLGAAIPARGRIRRLAALAAGAVAGAGPWVVEALVRFGGLGVRLEEAAERHVSADGPAFHLVEYVRASSIGAGAGRGPLWPAAAWWVGMAALVVAGLVRARRSAWFPAAAGVTAAAAFVAAFQFFVPPWAVVRFLLPALAAAAVAAGMGAAALLGGKRIAVAAGALALAWVSWQGVMAGRFIEAQRAPQGVAAEIADALERVAGGRPCEFASRSLGPQIQFRSGCRWSGAIPGARETPVRFRVLPYDPAGREDGRLVAVVGGRWAILDLEG